MALNKCNACNGEYRTLQRDGSTYFHVCPPQVILRVRLEDGTDQEGPIESFAGKIIVQSAAEKRELVNGGADPATIVVERNRRTVRREGHRDENTRRRDGPRGEIRVMRAEGAGITTLKTDRELEAEDSAGV